MSETAPASIDVTLANYRALKAAHHRATTHGQEQFIWDGHALVTNYAGYLLEYMHAELKARNIL